MPPKMKTVLLGEVPVSVLEGGLYDRYRLQPELKSIKKEFNIDDISFFESVPKHAFDQGVIGIGYFPVYYYDMGFIQAVFTADAAALKKLLPSSDLKVTGILPGRGMIVFTAFQYRVSDVDSYNEIAISVIVNKPYKKLPGFLAFLSAQLKQENWASVWQLPVTTDLACTGGKINYNFPKFIANIDYVSRDGHDECTMKDGGGNTVIKLSGRQLATAPHKTLINHSVCYKDGKLWDVPVWQNPVQTASSLKAADFTLELGRGEIPDVLRTLKIGRMLRYDYTPKAQTMLCAGKVIPNNK